MIRSSVSWRDGRKLCQTKGPPVEKAQLPSLVRAGTVVAGLVVAD